MIDNQTANSQPEISIIIPTKNGSRFIAEVLDGIYAQHPSRHPEVIVIDSGSSDGTPETAARYPVRLETIRPEAFNHGGTRNLGGRLAHPASRYLVFLTQDATPLAGWLENLVQALESDPGVAGAFSRHVPRPDCNPILARQMREDWEQCGTPERVSKRLTDRSDFDRRKIHYVYFANTSSCLRRSVWEAYPFPETDFAEDAQWAERVLLAGYTVVYEPASAVLHSHSYSLQEHCRQNFDHGRAMHPFLSASASPTRSPLAILRRDWTALWTDHGRPWWSKLYWSGYSPLWHGAAWLGSWLSGAQPISKVAGRWLSRQGHLKRR